MSGWQFSTTDDRRQFITLSVHVCLQQYGCDAAHRVVRLQQRKLGIISASLYERSAYVTGVARLAWTICLSPHVSSRVIPQCIGMPFGVVSGVAPGIGVLDRVQVPRGKGSFWNFSPH